VRFFGAASFRSVARLPLNKRSGALRARLTTRLPFRSVGVPTYLATTIVTSGATPRKRSRENAHLCSKRCYLLRSRVPKLMNSGVAAEP
jgi:hypothetical protein